MEGGGWLASPLQLSDTIQSIIYFWFPNLPFKSANTHLFKEAAKLGLHIKLVVLFRFDFNKRVGGREPTGKGEVHGDRALPRA